jgi:hypothetical protein
MAHIFGFMHSAMMGHWKQVNSELLDGMLASGLLDKCILHHGVVGYETTRFWTPFEHHNFFFNHLGSLKEYEYPTLSWLQQQCTDCYTDEEWRIWLEIPKNEPIYVFYCCNAGVSHPPNHDFYPDWRWLMHYFNHMKWRDCVAALNEGYDTVGIEWQTDPVPHWSGNFWWATAEYLATLPPIDRMKTFDAGKGINHKQHPRHGAEFWIGMNSDVKHKSLFQTGYSWRNRPRKEWCKEL